jgi:HAMP domain-containing protein
MSELTDRLRTNVRNKMPQWTIQGEAADEIERLTRERDEAREAAKQLLGQTATFADENKAIAKYPWLDYHA